MRGPQQRTWMVLVAVSIGVLSFVYRFNTLNGPLAGFDNDHFFQIVRAEAMLDGELPLRDYSDAELRSLWPPLTYASSAAAMKAMGRSLRSEAIMSVGMLAVGAAMLFWVAATVSRRILPAVLISLLAVGLAPTLYNYPKIVVYAFAVIAMLAYARSPGVWRLLALALTVVVATLYRHDHAVYLGFASLVLLLLVHGRGAGRPLMTYAAMVLVGLLPGLVFAQQHGGVIKYLRDCLTTSRREADRTGNLSLPFRLDLSQPLLVRVPPPAARIAVRWAEAVTPEGRAVAERELGLADPEPRDGGESWSYAVDGASPSRLAVIVQDPRVDDTAGVDRRTFALTAPPPARGGLFGWSLAPGVLHEENATPWLVLVAWSVIIVSMACLAWPPVRRASEQPDVPPAVIAAVTALGVPVCLVFLRNPAPYRLPDVAVPIVMLGAWLLAALPRAVRSRPRPVRIAMALLLALILGLSAVSVGLIGEVSGQVRATGLIEGPTGIVDRSRAVWKTLGGLPESTAGIDEMLASTATYLRRCTLPSDRVLVGDYVPEIYYFSRRGVAAGQSVFFGGFYTSETAQRESLERWERQSVPIALIQPAERFVDEFGSDYPVLANYLRAHYRRAGSLDATRGTRLDVWVKTDRDGTTDPETGLPCFA